MKSLIDVLNESVSVKDSQMVDALKAILTQDTDGLDITNGHKIKVSITGAGEIESENFAKNIAGHVVEEAVKVSLSSLGDFKDGGNDYYDFEFNGEKVEVKALLGGRMSNLKLTKPQYEHKNEMVFILVSYEASKDTITIKDLEVKEGKNLKN